MTRTTAPTPGTARGDEELIELETLRYGLIEAARDMHQTLMRSAFSPVVRDVMDCTAAIHMRTEQGWEMVASWEGCMQHAFTSQHICNFTMDEWDESELRDGDTILVNDPWRGAIHCADINLLRPVLIDGEARFVLHSTSHVVDLGGSIPGGFANGVQTAFEEQLKFPPTLLYSADKPVRSVFNYLLENVRVPAAVLGDIRALYGCLVIGEQRIRRLVEKYGADRVAAGARFGMDMTERSMRAGIAELDDGDYLAEDSLDDDGVEDEPIPLRATLKVRGDSIEVDYSGTGRQPLGNVGTAWIESTRCIEGIKFLVDPASPVNSGTLRPVEALLPPGSAVCVLPPSSCSNHMDVGGRIINMITQAVGQAAGDRTIGCDSGTAAGLTLGGVDTRSGHEGNPWATFVVPGGGWGGTWCSDGLSFCLLSIGNCRTPVQEHTERESPLVVWQHEMMPDSAGVGRFRGGFGGVYTVAALAPTVVTITGDRARRGAPGSQGGGRGMSLYGWRLPSFDPTRGMSPTDIRDAVPLFGVFGDNGIPDPDTGTFGRSTEYRSAKVSQIVLEPGDALRFVIGGGGGWGDPLQRPAELVLTDVRNGLHSEAFVRRGYGVVVTDGALDEAATTELRGSLAARREEGRWSPPDAGPVEWLR
jgi:N-methylhydantoinase B